MKALAKEKVVIIGCGNVAWHIAKHLQTLKLYTITIYNHKPNTSLSKFRTVLKCKTVVGLDAILEDAKLYFICVNDSSIAEVGGKIIAKHPNALLMHTSGSTKLEALGNRIHPVGVFYPLQTFSKEAEVNWEKVPILIESANRDTEHILLSLADLFTKQVYSLSYKSRLKFHLAAVLVNNFVNALYVSASDLIHTDSSSTNLSFELLLPLIGETTEKIKHLSPRLAQTGPAKRKDMEVMKKHLKLIKKETELHKVYKQLSHLIVKQQEN